MISATDALRLVTFRLGDDLFAADIAAVERVLRFEQPRELPSLPSWVIGVIEYRDRVVPVVDIRRRFALGVSAPTAQARLLILSCAGEWVAMVVDAVLEVRGVDEREIAPPPALFRGLAADYLRGVIRRQNQLVVVLEVDRVLSAEERHALEHLSEGPAREA
jgi:purine-binding chemotaxis protein CheW